MDLNTFGIEDVSDDDVALRFTIPATTLKRMLDKTSVVVSGKDFVPVLMNFCIQASPTAVRILTSSLDLAMLSSAKDVEVAIPGRAFFPVRRLTEIVSSAPAGQLLIEARGSATTGMSARITATAESGARTVWALALHSGAGYPNLPALGDLQMRQVPRAEFCDALRAVAYAAADPASSGNAALAAVQFSGQLTSACDGNRLALVRFSCDGLPEALTLPSGAVDDCLRLLDRPEPAVTETFLLGQTTTHIVMHHGGDALVIAQTSREYPDALTIETSELPRTRATIELERDAVADALRRVKTSIDVESPLVALTVSANGTVVHTKDRYGNTSVAELPGKVLIPNDMTLMFSYRYLLQLVQKFPESEMKMVFDPKLKNKAAAYFISKDESALSVLPQSVSF